MSFNLAIVLPRWDTYCVNCGTQGVSPRTPSIHRLQRGLPGYLILFAPPLSRLTVSYRPVIRLRHWCSSLYLRISPLHKEFRLPLRHSRPTVSNAVHGLSPWISHLTCRPGCTPFTPSKSGQRLPPTYYRGCWHVVSRGLFKGYRLLLFPLKRSLQPESLLPSRGVAGSGLRPLPNIPHCCLP